MALGAAPFGSMAGVFGFTLSDEESNTILRHCLRRGIHYIDTAPLYGEGLSEARIGNFLRENTTSRKDIILSTKVGWIPGGAGERSYTRDAILRSIDASLLRLQTDYLDIALVHDPDAGDFRSQVLDQAFPTLHELKSQGILRAIGAGMNQWQMLLDFAHNADVDCFLLAGRYTLLEQEPLETFFPVVLRKNIGIMLGGVFNGGILATGAVDGARHNYAPAPDPILRKTRQIEAVCARHHVPLRAAALQFAAAHPAVKSLIIGVAGAAQVDDNLAMLAASTTPIPSAFWQELRLENLIDLGAPTPS